MESYVIPIELESDTTRNSDVKDSYKRSSTQGDTTDLPAIGFREDSFKSKKKRSKTFHQTNNPKNYLCQPKPK